MTNSSPYSASITGCSFKFYEFMRVLPLLMADNADELLKQELELNEHIQINSRKARQTFLNEFKKRFTAVPRSFWLYFMEQDETAQRAGVLFSILKAYKLVFDFHFNVTVRKHNSIEQQVSKSDIIMELNEIAANDEFVDSWSDSTKEKCASTYITILKQSGLMIDNTLAPIRLTPEQAQYYFLANEEWFLEALLLLPYEINDIKSQLP